MNRKKNKIISMIIFLIVSIGLLLIKGFSPQYNWDMLGYTAIMYQWDGNSPEEVHEKTYNLVRESVPDEAYKNLTDIAQYQRSNAEDYEIFDSQLPFYKIRPLYNAVNYLAFKSGIPFIPFTYWFAIVCYLAQFLILIYWLNRIIRPYASLILSLILFGVLYYTKVMFFSTPDSFAGLLMFGAIFLTVHKENLFPALILLFLAQLARNDVIVYSIIFIAVYLYLFKIRRREALKISIAFSVMSLGAFFIINKMSGAYSYPVTFFHSFVWPLERPDVVDFGFDFEIYFRVLGENLHTLTERLFLICWLPPIGLIISFFSKACPEKKILFGVLSVGLMIAARFILFPIVWHRFFAQFYFIDIALLLILLNNILTRRTAIDKLRRLIYLDNLDFLKK